MQTIGSLPQFVAGVGYDWSAPLVLPQMGRGAVSFVSNATSGVVVGISPQAATVNPMYEIVIGANNNTQTIIRRSSQGTLCASAQAGVDTSSPDRPFWVSIDSATSTIQVGSGFVIGQSVILSWQDPSFLGTAQFVSFAYASSAIVYYAMQIHSLPLQLPARNGQYNWTAPSVLPAVGRSAISFTANGTSDVMIAISSQAATVNPMYEIVIGANNNTQTVIRRSAQGTNLASAPSGLTAPGADNQLWVSVDYTSMTVQVGRGLVGLNVFLSWQDPTINMLGGPDPLSSTCQYFTFSSGSTPITYSNVQTTFKDWSVKPAGNPVTFSSPSGNPAPFTPTGVYVVPTGVSAVLITATGGTGQPGQANILGSYGNGDVGHGATVTGLFPVTAGQSLYVMVAQNGSAGGFPGGGTGPSKGGGVSYVATQSPALSQSADTRLCSVDPSSLLIVAGGGGAGGGGASSGSGGWGGNAGLPGTAAQTGASGHGDGAGGAGRGGNVFSGGWQALAASNYIGQTDWHNGAYLRGGDCGAELFSGGAGGAGFWGGGGGSMSSGVSGTGGGGGGTSYVAQALCYQAAIDFTSSPSVTITPLSLIVQPAAPDATGWVNSLPLAGSMEWVTGCVVSYVTAYEYADGTLVYGPYGTSLSGQMNALGMLSAPGANPQLDNISCDPTGKAVARRIYRCLGTYYPRMVGRIPNNVDTHFVDMDPGAPLAPGVSIWCRNLPVPGSPVWVSGCQVRYRTGYEFADGTVVRGLVNQGGTWWTPPGAEAYPNYLSPGYACPVLISIPVDPNGVAVARRIYRQFAGQVEHMVGRIPNNTDTTFTDGNLGGLLPDTMLSFSDSPGSAVNLGNPAKLNITGVISIAAWVYPLATDGLRYVVARGYSTAPGGEVSLRIAGGNYEVGSWDGADHYAVAAIPAGDVGKWVHLAGVYDGTTWTLYRNGQVVAQAQSTGAVPVNAGWSFGSRGDSLERLFRGSICSVSIWNIALSPSGVQQCMNNGLAGTETGLMGYWPMNDGSGQRVIDVTANPVVGNLVNTNWTPNVTLPTTTLSFSDSPGSAVNMGNPGKLGLAFINSNQISITAWIHPLAADGLRNIVAHGYTLSPPAEIALRINGSSYYFGFWDNNGSRGVSAAMPAGDVGQWVHIAGVFDGSSCTFYRNGQAVAKTPVGGSVVPANAGWSIGSRGDTLERLFRGSIANVSIWNIALSPSGVQQCMNNALVGNESGLIDYWPLTEGTGQQVQDKAAGPVTGTLVNTQWISDPTRP